MPVTVTRELTERHLPGVDPAEVSDYLRVRWPGAAIRITPTGDGTLLVDVDDPTELEVAAALDEFTPTTNGADPADLSTLAWRARLPPDVLVHLQHLRDYLTAPPLTITPAQTVEAVKDVIRALRYVERRLE